MDDPRQQHGNHTWDVILNYYRCPKCGYILEDRTKFERVFHHLEKHLICSRCEHRFTVTKQPKATFGPLLGHDPEIAD